MIKLKTKRIICAMSGGLDSSVAAALLKNGYFCPNRLFYIENQEREKISKFEVVGVFMKFWSEAQENGIIGAQNKCCCPEAEARARKVAKILKIPFYVFDFQKEFKKQIVDYFLEGYRKGITPNPCIVCNKKIKFGLFLKKALELGADFIVTGHYARVWQEIPNSKSQISNYRLLRAKDRNKDQSYFLWQLNQKQLKKILFPIGDYTKREVEKFAKKFKLDFLLKIPKSTGICFIQTTLNDFLKKHLSQKPGFIVEKNSNHQKYSKTERLRILGRHEGLAFYTIGQRKGIKLTGGPYYVLDKDLKKNLLIVTHNEKDLYKKELFLKNVNWIAGKAPKLPLKIKAKIRYQHPSVPAILTSGLKNLKTYKLTFQKLQRAITPGQSVVFYSSLFKKDYEVIGGGIIR